MVRQERITTRHVGIDPQSIDAYVKVGGYEGLRRAVLQHGAGRVLDEMARARLRGRGGGGFPVVDKWHAVCEADGQPKYLVCNAYDADQDAPIGRSLLEQSPHTVLEGLLIAAFAVGAVRGFVYCRGEATRAINATTRAIEQAREQGFLGLGILGTDFDLELSVVSHWGGFIGGEETAMLAVLSGPHSQRAMPSQRPPFPAQAGFRGRPTLIHSAETLATIPWIMSNGGEQYAGIGTRESSGTKLFALHGDVRVRALVELPFGTTVREAIMDIGQGTASGRAIKAVHVGGPLGGCIPESLLDSPLDHEILNGLGVALGSGRLTPLNDSTCMAGYAQQVMSHLSDEACGKCVPCRLGTKRIASTLACITRNIGRGEDIDLASELAQNMRAASLCNFGVAAPNILSSSLKYFGDDFRQHFEQKSCPTAQCRPIRQYRYNRRAVL